MNTVTNKGTYAEADTTVYVDQLGTVVLTSSWINRIRHKGFKEYGEGLHRVELPVGKNVTVARWVGNELFALLRDIKQMQE